MGTLGLVVVGVVVAPGVVGAAVVVGAVVVVDRGPTAVTGLDDTDPVGLVPGVVGTFIGGAGVARVEGGVADMATTPLGTDADGVGAGR